MSKLVSTAQAKLMNQTYEILKPMSVEELRKAVFFAYQFTDDYYYAIYLYCIHETIRRKKKGIWK